MSHPKEAVCVPSSASPMARLRRGELNNSGVGLVRGGRARAHIAPPSCRARGRAGKVSLASASLNGNPVSLQTSFSADRQGLCVPLSVDRHYAAP